MGPEKSSLSANEESLNARIGGRSNLDVSGVIKEQSGVGKKRPRETEDMSKEVKASKVDQEQQIKQQKNESLNNADIAQVTNEELKETNASSTDKLKELEQNDDSSGS